MHAPLTMQSLKAIAVSSAIYAGGSFATKFAKFLLIPIYVRYLTPDEVGIVVFLEALILAAGRFFPLGLDQAIKRFYVDFPDRERADSFAATLWIAAFAFGITGAVVLGLAAAAFPGLFSSNVSPVLVAAALACGALRCPHGVAMQRFIVRGEALRHSGFETVELLSTVGLVMLFIVAFDWGVQGYLWAYIFSTAVWAVIFGCMIGREARPLVDASFLRPALHYALPLWPHGLFTWAITFLDRIILERMVPLSEVGVYGIGYQLASVVPVLSLAIINAWLPRYFRAASSHAGRRDYLRVLSGYCCFVALVVLGLYSTAPEIIAVVAVPEFRGATTILQITVIALAFHATYQAMILVLFYEQRGSQVSLATGIAMAVNIVGLLLFVPEFGINGAAWATVLAFACATLVVLMQAAGALSVSRSVVAAALLPVLVGVGALCVGQALQTGADVSTRAIGAIVMGVAVIGAWRLSDFWFRPMLVR